MGISIVPRGAAGGLTFFAPSEERLESGLYSRSYLENQMAVALGGRIAEELIFGADNVTTGASKDLMQTNMDALHAVTDLLLEKENVDGDEFERLLLEMGCKQYLKADEPSIAVPFQ